MRGSRLLKGFVGFLVVCIIILLCLVWPFYSLIKTPLLSAQESAIILHIDRATSAQQFANLLKNKQLIKAPKVLLSIIRWKGLSNKLKAGIYKVYPGEKILDLLNAVVIGDVLKENFKIIDGTTQKKISEDLAKAPYLMYQAQDWSTVQGTYANAEGLVLADTYQYEAGSSAKTLLQQAHRNLIDTLNRVWAQRDPNVPYKNPYELLIAASIIEKETGMAQEKSMISGVMLNRMKKNMPLQMDPTIIYGMGSKYQGKLSHQDVQIDSPYNSYKNRGLPPTPIAMVSKDTLEAAAHPQLSNYLYFVAKGDGQHQFSETYSQQKQAINQYRHKD